MKKKNSKCRNEFSEFSQQKELTIKIPNKGRPNEMKWGHLIPNTVYTNKKCDRVKNEVH